MATAQKSKDERAAFTREGGGGGDEGRLRQVQRSSNEMGVKGGLLKTLVWPLGGFLQRGFSDVQQRHGHLL